MISYAQNTEDVVLKRFFGDDEPQFYVDVGAGHPVFHSVSKHFYDAGWCGLNIEPRTCLFDLLSKERPRDINLSCGISDVPGSATFYEIAVPTDHSDDNGGLSTMDANLANKYRHQGFEVSESTRNLTTLTDLFIEHHVTEIGFLKIDVEGFESHVIKSLDWARWRPRIVVTESTVPMSNVVCDQDVSAFLSQRGYTPAYFDGLNRYFVRNEDLDRVSRISVPVSILDDYVTFYVVQLNEEIERLRSYVAGQNSAIEALESDRLLFQDKYAIQDSKLEELTSKLETTSDNARLLQFRVEELEKHCQQLTEMLEMKQDSLNKAVQEIGFWQKTAYRRTVKGRCDQVRAWINQYLHRSVSTESNITTSSAIHRQSRAA